MKPKVVKTCSMIVQRVSAAGLLPMLERFENLGFSEHPLDKVSTLEKVCGQTQVSRNPGLENALLVWVVHAIYGALLTKQVAFDDNRDVILSVARGALLSRRLVLYLASKTKLPGRSEQADPRSQEGFHRNFLTHADFEKSGLGEVASDLTWLGRLHPYQLELLPIMKSLLAPPLAYWSALRNSTDKSPQIAAEMALQEKQWQDLIDLPGLLGVRESLRGKLFFAPSLPPTHHRPQYSRPG